MRENIVNEIITYLKWAITSGEYNQMDKLPSENSLAIKFSCSRLTARNAMTNLKSDGLIISRKGKGYFVSLGNKKLIHTPLSGKRGVKEKFHIVDYSMSSSDINIFKELGATNDELKKCDFTFFKTNFDSNNKAYTLLFSKLNSSLIKDIDLDVLKGSVAKTLIKNRVIVSKRNEKILIENPAQIVKLKMHLKSSEKVVVAHSTMFDNKSNLVEVAIRYTTLDEYSEKFTKKY